MTATNVLGSLSAATTVIVTGTPTTTATSLTSAPNPSTYGQSVTFTATVKSAGGGIVASNGTITFLVDGTTLTRTLNGTGVATYITSTLYMGSHLIDAVYSGDANYPGVDHPR